MSSKWKIRTMVNAVLGNAGLKGTLVGIVNDGGGLMMLWLWLAVRTRLANKDF